eukprot:3273437-Amphidinium_carterae.1
MQDLSARDSIVGDALLIYAGAVGACSPFWVFCPDHAIEQDPQADAAAPQLAFALLSLFGYRAPPAPELPQFHHNITQKRHTNNPLIQKQL